MTRLAATTRSSVRLDAARADSLPAPHADNESDSPENKFGISLSQVLHVQLRLDS
jgi:hypothetical protein